MTNLLENLLKSDGISVYFPIGDYLMQQMFIQCFMVYNEKSILTKTSQGFMLWSILKHNELLFSLEAIDAHAQMCFKIRSILWSALFG
jgi:hypothetical protein